MNEYAKVIRLCTKDIVFCDERPYQNTHILQVFYYSLLMKHFHLRAYNRCRQVANKYKDIFPTDNYNWFKWQELHLLAELHAGRYEAAADVWEQVTARLEYFEPPVSTVEFWETTGTYLYFLGQCGRLRERKTERMFRHAKMPAGLPIIQPEKSGLQIPLLVIQFLIALADRDYGRCMDSQEMLSQYRMRFLDLEETARSNYFFQMLERIPQASFNQKEISRNTFPLLQKLQTTALRASKQYQPTELIPYETLWGLALELLNQTSQIRPLGNLK